MSAPRTDSTRASSAAVMVLLVCLAALVGRGFWGFSHDDAFITYRYADQWAHGNGLTFNTGEHVLGTSAPGYALLLGLLSKATGFLGVGVPEWGTLLSLAALLSLAWTLAAALSTASASVRLAVPLLFGIGTLLWRWNIEMLGSEALPVVALVAAGAYWVFVKEKHLAGGVALAAAMILRLDAGLAAASFGIVLWLSRRRFPWQFALVGSVPVAVWLAGLYSRFGSLIPATLAAKRWEYAAVRDGYWLAEWHWLRRSLPLSGSLALLLLAVLGGVLGVRRGLWRHPGVQALGLWLLAHEVLYRVVRVPFAPWYHEGLVNALLALAALSSVALGQAISSFWREGKEPLAAPLAAGLLLLPILAPSVAYVGAQWRRPPDPRFEIYRTIGLYLSERARPQSTVAAVEIGILGYFSRRNVLDLSGVVAPGVITARAEGRLAQVVAISSPNYILDVPGFRANALAFLSDPALSGLYRPAEEFEPLGGHPPYRLLENVALAEPR